MSFSLTLLARQDTLASPLDCEQGSRVHKGCCCSKERTGLASLSTTPFHRCGN